MAFVPLSVRQRYSQDEAGIRTLLGEAPASQPLHMQAVANVIQNRYASGNFGGDFYQVIRPSQFNGFDTSTPVGSPAWNTAAAAWNARNNDVTGGAYYFANPTYSTARWAGTLDPSNSLTIGDHYFSDRLGPASEGFSMAGQQLDARGQITSGVNPLNVGFGGFQNFDTLPNGTYLVPDSAGGLPIVADSNTGLAIGRLGNQYTPSVDGFYGSGIDPQGAPTFGGSQEYAPATGFAPSSEPWDYSMPGDVAPAASYTPEYGNFAGSGIDVNASSPYGDLQGAQTSFGNYSPGSVTSAGAPEIADAGASPYGNLGTAEAGLGAPASPYGTLDTAFQPEKPAATGDVFTGSAWGDNAQTLDPAYGDANNYAVPQGAPQQPTGNPGNQVAQAPKQQAPQQQAQGGGGGGGGGLSMAAAAKSIPLAIIYHEQGLKKDTEAATASFSQNTEKVTKNVSENTGKIEKSLASNTEKITTTATEVVDKTLGTTKNLFVRGGLIVLGFIFVAAGLAMFRQTSAVDALRKVAA